MKNILINTLEKFGFPVMLQGSLAEDEPYPESFFTFWNNDTESNMFYDNKEHATVWDFDVNFYSADPEKVDKILNEAKNALKNEGFIISGKGHDVASDEPTHTGRGLRALFKETEE